MSATSKIALDHIVILLSAKDLDSLPESFTKAFTITPGGTHADGKTYNKLVILESGVYLEFIAFVGDDRTKREEHWWGRKVAGSIIDWALTSDDVKDAENLQHVGYDKPRHGGRQRDDGQDVEWFVTFPSSGTERGSAPFFCHDVTPRELRVPKEGSSHPGRAASVEKLVLVVAPEKLPSLVQTYVYILGPPLTTTSKSWQVSEPSPVRAGDEEGTSGPILELRDAESEDDWQILRDNRGVAGVKEIWLWRPTADTGGKGTTERVEVCSEGGRKITICLHSS